VLIRKKENNIIQDSSSCENRQGASKKKKKKTVSAIYQPENGERLTRSRFCHQAVQISRDGLIQKAESRAARVRYAAEGNNISKLGSNTDLMCTRIVLSKKKCTPTIH